MIRLIITGELQCIWATKEELAEMTDAEIIELVKEDVTAFLDDAKWTVERSETKR